MVSLSDLLLTALRKRYNPTCREGVLPVRQAVDPRNIEVIDDELAQVLRDKTPAERVEMIGAANRTARLLAAAGIRYNHPDWDEAQIQAEVIRRVCGGTN